MLCYSSVVELEYFENLHKPLLCCDTFYYVLMCLKIERRYTFFFHDCMHISVLVVWPIFFDSFFLIICNSHHP